MISLISAGFPEASKTAGFCDHVLLVLEDLPTAFNLNVATVHFLHHLLCKALKQT